MFGLVLMAAELAIHRAHGTKTVWNPLNSRSGTFGFVDRETATRHPLVYSASAEYYRIIDRISQGLKP